MIVPLIIFVIDYLYYRTDTVRTFFSASVLLTIGIIILCVFLEFFRVKKYNYIALIILIIILHIILYQTNQLLIGSLKVRILTVIAMIVGISFHDNENRIRLLVTGIIMFILVAILQNPALEHIYRIDEKNNKANRIATEYLIANGHTVTNDDEFIVLGDTIRGKQIKIMVVRFGESNPPKFLKYLELIYYEGEIIAFNDYTNGE